MERSQQCLKKMHEQCIYKVDTCSSIYWLQLSLAVICLLISLHTDMNSNKCVPIKVFFPLLVFSELGTYYAHLATVNFGGSLGRKDIPPSFSKDPHISYWLVLPGPSLSSLLLLVKSDIFLSSLLDYLILILTQSSDAKMVFIHYSLIISISSLKHTATCYGKKSHLHEAYLHQVGFVSRLVLKWAYIQLPTSSFFLSPAIVSSNSTNLK